MNLLVLLGDSMLIADSLTDLFSEFIVVWVSGMNKKISNSMGCYGWNFPLLFQIPQNFSDVNSVNWWPSTRGMVILHTNSVNIPAPAWWLEHGKLHQIIRKKILGSWELEIEWSVAFYWDFYDKLHALTRARMCVWHMPPTTTCCHIAVTSMIAHFCQHSCIISIISFKHFFHEVIMVGVIFIKEHHNYWTMSISADSEGYKMPT